MGNVRVIEAPAKPEPLAEATSWPLYPPALTGTGHVFLGGICLVCGAWDGVA